MSAMPTGIPLPPLNLNMHTSSGATATGGVLTVNKGSDLKVPAMIIAAGAIAAVFVLRS